MEKIIERFIDGLDIGEPISAAGGVTLFAVFSRNPCGPQYQLIDEALNRGAVSIEEKGSGSVPVLVLVNRSEQMILVTCGDELIGGKQNRIVNVTVLIPGKSLVDLPVSCVEQGRWHSVAGGFRVGEKAYHKLRHVLQRDVHAHLRASGVPKSDQSRVCDSVGEELARAEAVSPTMAMRDAYAKRQAALKEMERRLSYVEGAAGVVCALGGEIAFAELFDRPETCRRVWPRLVRSLGFDTVNNGTLGGTAETREVRRFFEKAKQARVERFPSPGVGTDVRLSAETFAGSLLAADGAVIHCSLSRD